MSKRDKALTAFLATLRQHGIRDERVIEMMRRVPREHFVAGEESPRALADRALPIACGQTISQPYIVAAMTEALEISPEHRVLEIGTGSGYQAAILAGLAKEVVSVERHAALAQAAREKLGALGIENVTVIEGDGMKGAAERAPFDRIIVTAAAAELPPPLIGQLAAGGILVAPVGPPGEVQMLTRIRKEELMAVRFVPLLPGGGETS